MAYKIGNLELKSRVLLAPMLEPNDVAFRLLCKKAGCGLTYTGMVSPLSKQKMRLDDKPAVQLFGNSVKGIKSFIKKYDSKVSLWDFNLGCPSKLSKMLGHGGCLDDINVIEKILKVMRSSTDKPISIKLRKSDRAIEIAKMAEKYVDAIGIHARTVSQGYAGEVDYDFALKLKRAVKCPVIFSGNVDAENIDSILKDFDFVFVGRAAIGNPNFFLRKKLVGSGELVVGSNFGFIEYLKLAKKYGLFFRQIKYQAMNFTKGVKGAAKIRGGLVETESVDEIEEVMGKVK
jgi:tRNA-dihydrouridine synthase B